MFVGNHNAIRSTNQHFAGETRGNVFHSKKKWGTSGAWDQLDLIAASGFVVGYLLSESRVPGANS
jgi:hypothetical protein